MIRSIKTIMRQDREPYRIPRRVQDVIPIQCVWPDGIFKVGIKFSKTYRFTDINYKVAGQEDKETMFRVYSELLNSLDCAATTKLTICNRRQSQADFEQSVLMPMREDGLDKYRREYNQMLMDKATGANGITQEKYVTITVYKRDIEDARAYSIAVPQFVTLLLVRNFFSDAGICNTMMNNAGVTDLLKTIGLLGQSMDHIPFLTDQHWAKFMIIMINIWVGIPYQMLIATGVLMNIPSDILEASTIDGASPLQCFIYIKLPYLLSVQGPALVTDFVKNVNNFNVIYLLTQDVYITKDQAMASSSAKEVDLLVTWLFRLTQEQYNYKMAAVIGIMVFIICAIFTLVCFRFINKKEATFS